MVVVFHFLKAHTGRHLDLMINPRYLSVDFFFLLSGFVIGYAYDDRWRITLKELRIIRLFVSTRNEYTPIRILSTKRRLFLPERLRAVCY